MSLAQLVQDIFALLTLATPLLDVKMYGNVKPVLIYLSKGRLYKETFVQVSFYNC